MHAVAMRRNNEKADALLWERRILVTGASKGLGRATAEHCARLGATVVLTSRSQEKLDAVRQAIVDQGGSAVAIAADLTSAEEVLDLAKRCLDELGAPVDSLVNNAGIFMARSFDRLEDQDWEWLLDTNVVATARITRIFLPQLLSAEQGRLVFVASNGGLKGTVGQSAYNASKHAQIGLMRCLALEYGHTSLRINAVCPGMVLTPMVALEEVAAARGVPTDSLLDAATRATPIGRLVEPSEVAATIGFLMSQGADGIHGQALAVDGGVVY